MLAHMGMEWHGRAVALTLALRRACRSFGRAAVADSDPSSTPASAASLRRSGRLSLRGALLSCRLRWE